MAESIKVKHSEVEIEYNEENDRWDFTVGGRERFAKSLSKAREAIDTVPATKKKGFEPFKAYWTSTSQYQIRNVVTVTSVAEKSSGMYGPSFWIKTERGERTKVAQGQLAAITPENEAIIDKLCELGDQQRSIGKEITKLWESVKHVEVPSEAKE